MAIWQYTFHLLPKQSVRLLNPKLLFEVNEEGFFEDELYWSYHQYKRHFFSEIESFLGKGKSWCNEIDIYGSEDSNCVEVLFNGETSIVESVSLRVNFTLDFEDFLKYIIEFCVLKGLVLLNEKIEVVLPDFVVLKKIIEEAKLKYKGFVESPTAYKPNTT